ncbi:zinc finger, GRF-type [Artemisia annua]|uniref:Zinc finger, GRF-type n=1 Tax=Artemisia annua TaxID=35608 RepID=A0A2U1LDI9_ARTAN|nr:zinc finger, GRF-type [Artemisia annua]
MNCFCGNPTIVRTSWTNINPGRRFRCCPQIGTYCPFFSWVDPPMCARAMAIIPGLLASRNALEQSVNAMAVANRRLKIWLICSWIFFMIFYFM